jgi:hypothetical protein
MSECLTFSAAPHRFQPRGLLAPATDGKRGTVISLAVLIAGRVARRRATIGETRGEVGD